MDQKKQVVNCPSCGSQNVSTSERVSPGEIINLYRKHQVAVDDHFQNVSEVLYRHCNDCELRFFSPRICGNEDFYNQLQKHEWYFLHQDKTEFAYSDQFIVSNDRVLDVGSGRGVWRKYITKDVFYQGIEFSDKAIELAKKDGVNVIKESVNEHAVKFFEFYNVIGIFQVLEHVDQVVPFMQACLSCLKPGGKLIIAVPNNDGFIKNLSNNWLNIPPHHVNHWNEKSLKQLADKLLLKVIKVEKEKVTKVHQLLFYNIKHTATFNRLLHIPKKLIDNSFGFKIINKISLLYSKLFFGKSNLHLREDGHTIIVVMEK